MANKKDSKPKQEGHFLIARVDKKYKKKFDVKAIKENLKSGTVLKYLADGWLNGNITIDINVVIKQKK